MPNFRVSGTIFMYSFLKYEKGYRTFSCFVRVAGA